LWYASPEGWTAKNVGTASSSVKVLMVAEMPPVIAFLAWAWKLTNDKARELGWIV